MNLLDVTFEGITGEQVKSLRVRTMDLRTVRAQIASDIRDASRLYLLVEGVRRLWRILDADEQSRYATLCEPYVKTEAEHYVYRIRGKSATDAAVAAIGLVLAQTLGEVRFRHDKVPVWGRLRVARMVVAPAAMCNCAGFTGIWPKRGDADRCSPLSRT